MLCACLWHERQALRLTIDAQLSQSGLRDSTRLPDSHTVVDALINGLPSSLGRDPHTLVRNALLLCDALPGLTLADMFMRSASLDSETLAVYVCLVHHLRTLPVYSVMHIYNV